MHSRSYFSQILLLFCLACSLSIVSCVNLGPTTLKSERSKYNVSVQKTNDEELLLNLVRLKYRDTPFFMEVSSMASQFTLSSSANAEINSMKLGGRLGVGPDAPGAFLRLFIR